MTTVLTEAGACEVPDASPDGDDLWLSKAALTRATDWELKPEGLCRGEICVPLPRAERQHYLRDDKVNVAALWRLLERPALHDADGSTWMLGAGCADRARDLASLQAPDFELPDLSGQLHRLSDFRGKRVFLTTWSSW